MKKEREGMKLEWFPDSFSRRSIFIFFQDHLEKRDVRLGSLMIFNHVPREGAMENWMAQRNH